MFGYLLASIVVWIAVILASLGGATFICLYTKMEPRTPTYYLCIFLIALIIYLSLQKTGGDPIGNWPK